MFDRPGGTVKFIDFGLATQMNQGSLEIAGTPYYIAPEVLDECYGKPCDIWSLGVVLFQLMSGHMPFDGKSHTELFNSIKRKQPQIPDYFSPDLKDIVLKMLVKDPCNRITPQQALNHPWFDAAKEHIVVDPKAYDDAIMRLKAFNGASKLKRAAINIMVKQMAEEQHDTMHKVFQQIAKDHSGAIDK